jgi:hypothetical protein
MFAEEAGFEPAADVPLFLSGEVPSTSRPLLYRAGVFPDKRNRPVPCRVGGSTRG